MATGTLESGVLIHCAFEHCRVMDVTVPSGGVVAGQLSKINDLVGMYMAALDADDLGAFLWKCPLVEVACETADSTGYCGGSKVYYDATNARVTTTVGSNTLCGVVMKDSVLGDTTVWIALDGTLGIVA